MGNTLRSLSARVIAAAVLTQVFSQGRSLTAVLPLAVTSLSERDQAFVQTLCYGVLRWFPRLEYLTQQLLHKPLRARDTDIHTLLLLGLYQLIEMSIPAHAALSETVAAAENLGKPWAKKLINATLRTYLRNEATLQAKLITHDIANTAHPWWLLEAIRHYWPDSWPQIIAANNNHPPLSLRINRLQKNREDYLKTLQYNHIKAHAIPYTESGIILEQPCSVTTLPGFSQGHISVQDGSGQRAVPLLALKPGLRILDACAAPGGKTSHILELEPQLDTLIALDIDTSRLERIKENLNRLQLTAQIIQGDATNPKTWWDGISFDRILLDAPCSGTGVIRRHPDIKVLRREDDISKLITLQKRLLSALWSLLTPRGLLLYCTCSILPSENEQQILEFLSTHPNAREQPLQVPWGIPQAVGRQLLTGTEELDGFYYACLEKY
ncbi:rRNA SAM-dependent methyltransferase [Candidatus Nitrosoglobus terrae]|uniref:16S rRNA (cytosine(967)-C(5))-methyltransferase n=1 Tax=Candidatus Nitrosoglobus terrae TaxID=1630141 RepID=A0A1Q2SPE6_9GAMM|nr:16S rRNA (cytosine(967)-C(5))-methyltransferase RsmB [Candidatus Nitrosoglobus terrae]BAW81018.1 rRNA SAM-dependent methyltransferase [Candidatus Nitrosoglobus terrae]